MKTLHVYNTESKTKVSITPSDSKTVRLYTCGPTIYNYAHIGNFRTYVFEDLLKRTLKYLGYPVLHVMNLTDVDDKTIKGAREQNVSLQEFNEKYKKAFFEDLQTLNIEKADKYPAATDHIPEMIDLIQSLLDKGIAYKNPQGDVFYSIKKFPSYGRLSHLQLDQLKVGASERISDDEYEKDQASDFVLWKAYDEKRDGSVFWESPFGKGRPGWHIECSAMALKELGSNIDLHCGGVDNIFPHHENEIAQSEAASGKPFVKCWAHCEHLIVEGKKMSKSLGNFYTLRDLLDKGYTGAQIRMLLLSTHYRTQLNFTMQGLAGAKSAIDRIHDFIDRIKEANFTNSLSDKELDLVQANFAEALCDDLNISKALATIFDFIRFCNTKLDEKLLGKEDCDKIMQLFKQFDQVLGIIFVESDIEVPTSVTDLANQREQARKNKDFSLADRLRDQITHLGYIIEDTPNGPKIKKH